MFYEALTRNLPHRLKHLGKMVLLSQYANEFRDLRNLHSVARYTRCTTNLLGPELEVLDAASFCAMYDEIFRKQIYKFKAKSDCPLIIDGGANIGVSVLYFKHLYPQSRIIAFEPDATIFTTLQRNLSNFQVDKIDLIKKALWSSDTSLDFMVEGADGGRVTNLDVTYANHLVEATALSHYLDQPVDFLKLDIEGAETEVLLSCRKYLRNVENIFVEYHSFTQQPQTLNVILEILKTENFRVHIHPSSISSHPFLSEWQPNLGMDMQLNIFAYRR